MNAAKMGIKMRRCPARSRPRHPLRRRQVMTDSGTEDAPRLDALLPPEMARHAEEIEVKKASMDALGTLAPAVRAGA